ncbi:putative phosphoglycerate mutase pmu1 [Knufia fluminis]|uniref:Phosphoglycerate mutase pmu1 n=1 Tax=Knufia fluminis TaxID=191047 RepID=A0AAN8EDM0_9EURO|nr:putative phosphoglycerate mutase pmu1 [Knufia fluminis]
MAESVSQPSAQPAQAALPITSDGIQQAKDIHFTFTAPPSYFLPSLESTNPATFDLTTTNFGLISQPYSSDSSLDRRHNDDPPPTNWQRFAHHISTLDEHAPTDTSYHILYLARHGQGYHNLAEGYYGTQPWDCYWAQLDGDPESSITWADAHLSKLGEQQAGEQSRFWKTQLAEARMPVPCSWFVSPMERACRTAQITFEGLAREGKVYGEWKPIVKELLRETNGVHTCDRRSRRSVIAERYPEYQIEEGFSEEDELWDPVFRETEEAHTYRAASLLDDVLGQVRGKGEKGKYISFTAHGGMINAILRAVGHRQFQVKVGSAIAVLVKAEAREGKRAHQDFEKGKTKPDCVGDPLKTGLPGYDGFKDYVDKVEASVKDG